jgi:hypothetical protein
MVWGLQGSKKDTNVVGYVRKVEGLWEEYRE